MNKSIISFGEHIRGLRLNSKCSIKEIAKILAIDPSILGKFERNERCPNNDLIKKIAVCFNQDEKLLKKQLISDQFASTILEENGDLEILKVAEKKVKLKTNIAKRSNNL